MRDNKICLSSIMRNLCEMEFRWTSYLLDPDPEGKNRGFILWKIPFV
jgi:hypothetical protein